MAEYKGGEEGAQLYEVTDDEGKEAIKELFDSLEGKWIKE